MLEYQNIFTQVQVQGPPEMGVDPGDISRERTKNARFSTLLGYF
ncbi:MAG: photosynthetic reaction center subunit M, partial [Pseudomonadota bacterium]